MELLEFGRYPTAERRRSPQNYYSDINELGDGSGGDRLRRDRSSRRLISPIASPKRRRGDGERPPPPASEKDYDGALLSSLLERKARLREVSQGRSDSDTPSKGSSGQSSCRAELVDPPPPPPLLARSEAERHPADRPARIRPDQSSPHSPPGRREEPRDRSRKVVSVSPPGEISHLVGVKQP